MGIWFGSDDDGAEAVEDGFNGDGCIEAGEVENWVWDSGGIGFIGLKDQEEPFIIGCGQGGKGGYFLKRLIVFDVGKF